MLRNTIENELSCAFCYGIFPAVNGYEIWRETNPLSSIVNMDIENKLFFEEYIVPRTKSKPVPYLYYNLNRIIWYSPFDYLIIKENRFLFAMEINGIGHNPKNDFWKWLACMIFKIPIIFIEPYFIKKIQTVYDMALERKGNILQIKDNSYSKRHPKIFGWNCDYFGLKVLFELYLCLFDKNYWEDKNYCEVEYWREELKYWGEEVRKFYEELYETIRINIINNTFDEKLLIGIYNKYKEGLTSEKLFIRAKNTLNRLEGGS